MNIILNTLNKIKKIQLIVQMKRKLTFNSCNKFKHLNNVQFNLIKKIYSVKLKQEQNNYPQKLIMRLK